MTAKYKIAVNANEGGYVDRIEAKNIGQAVVNLGGGRLKKGDQIDYAVGIEVLKKVGDRVEQGDTLLYIYANDENLGNSQIEFLRNSYSYVREPVKKLKGILDVVESI